MVEINVTIIDQDSGEDMVLSRKNNKFYLNHLRLHLPERLINEDTWTITEKLYSLYHFDDDNYDFGFLDGLEIQPLLDVFLVALIENIINQDLQITVINETTIQDNNGMLHQLPVVGNYLAPDSWLSDWAIFVEEVVGEKFKQPIGSNISENFLADGL